MSATADELVAAVFQPEVADPADTAANLESAVRAIAAAGERGARLLLMPETFPGPMRPEAELDAEPEIGAAAKRSGVAVCWSRLELSGGRAHVVAYLTAADGERALRYVRAHPATGDVHPVLHGARVSPGRELGLVSLLGTRLGVTICSELWLPEAARVLCLRGAEVILGPAGGGFGEVAENWRLIARARALENNCHVLMTHSRFDGERGHALIAGPEGVLADGEGGDGLVVATLDLARGRWLRGRDDSMEKPKPFRALPGLLRAGRPELYGELAEPRTGAYRYE